MIAELLELPTPTPAPSRSPDVGCNDRAGNGVRRHLGVAPDDDHMIAAIPGLVRDLHGGRFRHFPGQEMAPSASMTSSTWVGLTIV